MGFFSDDINHYPSFNITHSSLYPVDSLRTEFNLLPAILNNYGIPEYIKATASAERSMNTVSSVGIKKYLDFVKLQSTSFTKVAPLASRIVLFNRGDVETFLIQEFGTDITVVESNLTHLTDEEWAWVNMGDFNSSFNFSAKTVIIQVPLYIDTTLPTVCNCTVDGLKVTARKLESTIDLDDPSTYDRIINPEYDDVSDQPYYLYTPKTLKIYTMPTKVGNLFFYSEYEINSIRYLWFMKDTDVIEQTAPKYSSLKTMLSSYEEDIFQDLYALPPIPLRVENQDFDTLQEKEEVIKAMSFFGLEAEELKDTLKESILDSLRLSNSEAKEDWIDNLFITFEVPVNSTERYDMEYLYRFFSLMFLDAGRENSTIALSFDSGSYKINMSTDSIKETTVPMDALDISGEYYSSFVNKDSTITVKSRNQIQEVVDSASTELIRPTAKFNVNKSVLLFDANGVYIEGYYTMSPKYVYQYFEDETGRKGIKEVRKEVGESIEFTRVNSSDKTVITVTNLTVARFIRDTQYTKYSSSILSTSASQIDGLTVPVSQLLLKDLSRAGETAVSKSSLAASVYIATVKVVRSKWYKSFLASVLFLASGFLLLVSLGQSASFSSSLMKLAEQLLHSYLANEAIKILVDTLGIEGTILLILYGASQGWFSDFSSTDLESLTKKLAEISNLIVKAIQVNTGREFEAIKANRKSFLEREKEANDVLNSMKRELGRNPDDTPMFKHTDRRTKFTPMSPEAYLRASVVSPSMYLYASITYPLQQHKMTKNSGTDFEKLGILV